MRARSLFAGLLVTGALLAGGSRADVPMQLVVVDPTSPSNPWAKQLADVDNDGDLDLVVGGDGDQVVWYRNPGWQSFEIDDVGSTESGSAAADLDGDGDVDLVVGARWYENPLPSGVPTAGPWTARDFENAPGSHDVRIGDLDRDGKPDVVIRGETASLVSLYRQVSPSQWTRRDLEPGIGRNGLELADLDRDGRLDIVVSGRWLRAPIDPWAGVWTSHDFGSWDAYAAIAAADLDRDGWIDLALTPSEGIGDIAWFENPGDPTSSSAWPAHPIDVGLERAHALVVGDLDRDGDLDLATSEFDGAGRLLLYFSAGGSATGWVRQVVANPFLHNLVGGDVEPDGDLDLAGTGTFGVTHVHLWRSHLAVFVDGFESGALASWSSHVP